MVERLYFECSPECAVQSSVSSGVEQEQRKKSGPARLAQAQADPENQFSFGARRCATRRLFVPQTPLMSPVFEPEAVRPHSILRVISNCS
jgi:hypothetical protein